MIHTEDITEDLLLERFDALPEALKQALDSENTLRIVEEVCRSNHVLDEEKVSIVQQIAGLVLFGFIHDYDAASETNRFLKSSDPRLGQVIGEALAVKVFAPLKADLDKNYRPVPATAASAVAPVSLPTAPSSPFPSGMPVVPPIVSATPRVVPPKPAESFAKAGGPLPVVLAPASRPASAPSPEGAAPKPAPAPAPFVIHQETRFSPIAPKPPGENGSVQPKAAFRIQMPTPAGGQMGGITKQAAMPARIELGKTPMPTPPPKPTIARTESEAPRVVHYTQFSSPATETEASRMTSPSGGLVPPKPAGGGGLASLEQGRSGPMPLSAIGLKTSQKPPAPRPSLDMPLEKPSVVFRPPPRPPGA